MSKKWAILIVVVVMVVVYLFLLVGLPALSAMVPSCGDVSSNETASDNCIPCEEDNDNAVTEATANWTTFPARDARSWRETYKTPWIMMAVPGLVGIAFIVLILGQKKEEK